jgi:hypothetical protein
MRLFIEEKGVYAIVESVDSRDLAPCACGGHPSKKVDEDYLSASELGRPAGAKGEDLYISWMECDQCGHITELYDWPKAKEWSCTIEDEKGNYLYSSEAPSMEEAIKKASEGYEDCSSYEETIEETVTRFGVLPYDGSEGGDPETW